MIRRTCLFLALALTGSYLAGIGWDHSLTDPAGYIVAAAGVLIVIAGGVATLPSWERV
jgi:hypothetical protein